MKVNKSDKIKGKIIVCSIKRRHTWCALQNVVQTYALTIYRKVLVHTNGMAVEVLGNTFNVRDRHAVSSVTLQPGKVLVNMNEGEQVTLQPGERLEINRKEIGRSHV